MRDGDPPLRLLCLPNTPLQRIVRCMQHIDQFALSLVSQQCKDLVKSIDLKCLDVYVLVDSEITVRTRITDDCWIKCSLNDVQVSIDNPSPTGVKSNVLTLHDGKGFAHSKPEYLVEDWLSHILQIFHQTEINTIRLLTPLRDVQSFRKTFTSCSTIVFKARSEREAVDLSMTFCPLKKLEFGVCRIAEHNETDETFPKIFIQNLEEIAVHLMCELTLDDLLIANSRIFRIYCQTIINFPKMLNRFIKHWLAGSNPRTRYFEFQCTGYLFLSNNNEVLKGIKHEIVSKMDPTALQAFRTFGVANVKFHGGYNICRKDGTVATLSFPRYSRFEMLVWP
ncbi:hypothetical protein GCK72_008391 [Caenorhabditis remanei]|uniref:F-box domain-containing protein n=1 Tax=Caenorhabditis remanei TaxID=31234 RepID=A0A6A5GZW8_CAERE|nr:hypothetical protein GCK72_008391 [Caenorhabditis remanei]KAF1760145.1 hypothetical protein GCK72_008391 [Caenorhabditis remanei]